MTTRAAYRSSRSERGVNGPTPGLDARRPWMTVSVVGAARYLIG